MNKSINTNKENINYYSEAIKAAEDNDFVEFLKWFNGGENLTSIINSGYRNLFCDILKPVIFEQSKINSKKMTALEIGCGGGRILNAACKYFGKAIGVDIHNSFEALDKFMAIENTNYELYKIENNIFNVGNNSIDFVYSYIVFQHILTIKTFEEYLKEINRILKKKSYSIIYFGRPRLLSKRIFKFKLLDYICFYFDKFIYENIFLNYFRKGYFEDYKAQVNHVNLTVSMQKAMKIFKENDFKIIRKGFTKNRNRYGTQYYLIVKKC